MKAVLDQMTKAYVLINADMGNENNIIESVRKLEHISQAFTLYGVYDLIVEIEANDIESINECITEKIRTIKSVRSTNTLVVIA